MLQVNIFQFQSFVMKLNIWGFHESELKLTTEKMLFNCKLITFNLKQKFCFDTKRLENTSNTSVQQKKPQTVNTKENVSREVHRCTDRCRPQVSLKCIGMSVYVCVLLCTPRFVWFGGSTGAEEERCHFGGIWGFLHKEAHYVLIAHINQQSSKT